MAYVDAKRQCESDGAHLAYPMFDAENVFIANIIFGQFWIGINDIDEEGKFVTVDGLDVSYTNWKNTDGINEPNNLNNEDGVISNFRGHGFWNDVKTYWKYKFVCHYRIESKFILRVPFSANFES